MSFPACGELPKKGKTPEELRIYWREQRKRWRAKNREKARAGNRNWRLANLEKARIQSREACKRYLAKPEKKELARQYFKEYGKKNRKKISVYQKSWVEKNRDKAKAYIAKFDAANREKRQLAAQQRRLKNPDQVRANEDRWRKKNPAKLFAKENLRKNAPGVFDNEKFAARIAFFGNACAYCGGVVEHLDHAIAISRGGTNWPANCRPACKKCNLKKSNDDWRNWRVRL